MQKTTRTDGGGTPMNIDERFSRDSTWAFFGVWASSVQTQYPKDPKEQRWESRFFMCMMLEWYKVSFQKLDRLRPHHFTTSAQLPWRRSFFLSSSPPVQRHVEVTMVLVTMLHVFSVQHGPKQRQTSTSKPSEYYNCWFQGVLQL